MCTYDECLEYCILVCFKGKPGSSDSGPVLDQELPPELNELVVKFV